MRSLSGLVLSVVLLFPLPSWGQLSPLEVHVINVGQADAILIRCPHGNHEMLIDAGDTRYRGSSRMFRDYIQSLTPPIDVLEVVIASHPHADHIGSMAWVLNNYTVNLYVDNGNVYDTRTYERVEDAWDDNGAAYWSAQDPQETPDIDFCPLQEVQAIVLVPGRFGIAENPNDNSVVVRLDYQNDSFLFVGDAGQELEELLLDDPATATLVDVDFLKVGHHASATSSTPQFLAVVTPEIAAVSCGARDVSTNTGYRHPRREVIERLLGRAGPRQGSNRRLQAYDSARRQWRRITLNRAVYVTTVSGNLVFESNGNGITRRTGN